MVSLSGTKELMPARDSKGWPVHSLSTHEHRTVGFKVNTVWRVSRSHKLKVQCRVLTMQG